MSKEQKQEIVNLYNQIRQNLDLGLDNQVTIKSLCTQPTKYSRMFKIMFPFLHYDVTQIEKENNPPGEKLQGLIEYLSYPVLTMDLSHISGNAIAQGDIRHLLNFIQILLELSVLYKKQKQQDSKTGSLSDFPYIEQKSQEEYIPSENEGDESQRAYSEPQPPQGSSSERKKIKRTKSKKDLRQSSGKKLSNSKENQLKAIEENLLSVTQKQTRIITTDPNIATKIKQKHSGRKQLNEQSQDIEEGEEEEQPQEEISEVDLEFLQQVDQEELGKLPEDHEIVQKYLRELQKLELIKMQQQSGGNIDDLIDVQIQIVKDSLKKMRNQPAVDEKETVEQLIKNRNAYKQFLKDYLKNYDQKEKKVAEQKQRQNQNQGKKQNRLKKEKEDLQKEFENAHLSMYYKLRDEKLNYLRKIHRIIFELEKRKIIDEKKDHLQVRRQQNVIARNALSSIENAYNDKITMLKEKLQNERKERHQAGLAQKEILSKLERELRQEKIKQIGDLKDMWRQEKERFDYMIKDDGELEKRILQIYKKY